MDQITPIRRWLDAEERLKIKNFSEKLNIKELADLIQISESSLYQNFKTVTSMSPIQFQKKLIDAFC